MEVSCNTVFAKLGVEVGLDGMVDTAEKFGFNDDGLRVPSRVAESVFDTDMNDAQLALSSIGQYNTAATPLQMAMVASAVANDAGCASRIWSTGSPIPRATRWPSPAPAPTSGQWTPARRRCCAN